MQKTDVIYISENVQVSIYTILHVVFVFLPSSKYHMMII